MSGYLRMIFIVAISLLLFSGTASALNMVWFDVELTMDGDIKNYKTASATVGDFLSEQGVVLGPLDSVSPIAIKSLNSNETTKIVILKGFDITVDIDGSAQKMHVSAGTKARDVIKRLERQNNMSYMLAETITEPLAPGHKLRLNRIFYEDQLTSVPLIYDTEVIFDDHMEIGEERIDQAGAAGEMMILSSLILINGNVVRSQITSEEIVKNPVTEIVRRGTKEPLPKVQTEVALRSYTQVYEMTATAYTAGFECTGKRPGQPGYGITASGIPVDHGIVAVDPRVIPLGTRLYIEGYGESLAADTGGSIVGNKIDLYHESLEDARRFGRRTVKVYVLG